MVRPPRITSSARCIARPRPPTWPVKRKAAPYRKQSNQARTGLVCSCHGAGQSTGCAATTVPYFGDNPLPFASITSTAGPRGEHLVLLYRRRTTRCARPLDLRPQRGELDARGGDFSTCVEMGMVGRRPRLRPLRRLPPERTWGSPLLSVHPRARHSGKRVLALTERSPGDCGHLVFIRISEPVP